MSKTGTLIVSLVFITLCGVGIMLFLPFHEVRADAINWQLNDYAFMILPARDVSIPIFSITYGSMILYLLFNYKESHYLSKAFFAYGIMLLLRMIALSLVPLKEPDSIILLEDPFLNNLIYDLTDSGDLINADLFFSGHTGLLCSLFFLSKRKIVFLILGIALAILLLVQRVHYSIDILGAIPFAYLSVWMSKKLVLRLSKRT